MYFLYLPFGGSPVTYYSDWRPFTILASLLPGLKSSRNGYSQRQSSYPRTRSVVCTLLHQASYIGNI